MKEEIKDELKQMYQASYYDIVVSSWHSNARNQNKQLMYVSTILMMFASAIVIIGGMNNLFLTTAIICFTTTILLTNLIYSLNFKLLNYIVFGLIGKDYNKKEEAVNSKLCKITDVMVPVAFVSGILSLVTFVIWR